MDPEFLGIPDYHKVIPKKEARDLRTIRARLDADKYTNLDMFEADVRLMVNNGIKFNGEASDVGIRGKALLKRILEMLEPIRSPRKRKDDTDDSTPVKKQRV